MTSFLNDLLLHPGQECAIPDDPAEKEQGSGVQKLPDDSNNGKGNTTRDS